jgi:hypothetical protein
MAWKSKYPITMPEPEHLSDRQVYRPDSTLSKQEKNQFSFEEKEI